MGLGTQALLALFPIALGGTLLVGFRVPAKHAMPAAYVAAALVALEGWRMAPSRIAAACLRREIIQGVIQKYQNDQQKR